MMTKRIAATWMVPFLILGLSACATGKPRIVETKWPMVRQPASGAKKMGHARWHASRHSWRKIASLDEFNSMKDEILALLAKDPKADIVAHLMDRGHVRNDLNIVGEGGGGDEFSGDFSTVAFCPIGVQLYSEEMDRCLAYTMETDNNGKVSHLLGPVSALLEKLPPKAAHNFACDSYIVRIGEDFKPICELSEAERQAAIAASGGQLTAEMLQTRMTKVSEREALYLKFGMAVIRNIDGAPGVQVIASH